jgi:hypothetical protein
MFGLKRICSVKLGLLRRHFMTLNDTSGLTEEHLAVQKTALDFAEQKLRPFALEWD